MAAVDHPQHHSGSSVPRRALGSVVPYCIVPLSCKWLSFALREDQQKTKRRASFVDQGCKVCETKLHTQIKISIVLHAYLQIKTTKPHSKHVNTPFWFSVANFLNSKAPPSVWSVCGRRMCNIFTANHHWGQRNQEKLPYHGKLREKCIGEHFNWECNMATNYIPRCSGPPLQDNFAIPHITCWSLHNTKIRINDNITDCNSETVISTTNTFTYECNFLAVFCSIVAKPSCSSSCWENVCCLGFHRFCIVGTHNFAQSKSMTPQWSVLSVLQSPCGWPRLL